jgi:hypothetical protein
MTGGFMSDGKDKWQIDIESAIKEARKRFLRADSIRKRLEFVELTDPNQRTLSNELLGDIDSYMSDEMIGLNRTVKALQTKLEDVYGQESKNTTD